MDGGKKKTKEYELDMMGNDSEDSGDDDYIVLDKESLHILEQELDFERKFYELVCNTDNFEVIAVPDDKGYIITEQERKYLEVTAKEKGIKLLYRISHGFYATVFDKETGKVGIMSESNSKGFTC